MIVRILLKNIIECSPGFPGWRDYIIDVLFNSNVERYRVEIFGHTRVSAIDKFVNILGECMDAYTEATHGSDVKQREARIALYANLCPDKWRCVTRIYGTLLAIMNFEIGIKWIENYSSPHWKIEVVYQII